MSLFRKLNTKAEPEINTGFGVNSADYGGRFVNKNGVPNIEKKGISFFKKISLYHALLHLPGWQFYSGIFIFFIAINLCFAVVYNLIG
ncbi:MAG: transporter, partial [Ginsengibacter sp.]